ncbi:MAG: phosphoenolpyruvate--protein phosphotransferase [Deltaproteobacteria bacterium]|nr:phosphoenolpyruvate--protein phosphotransferase [Deltaproteobacteria bacterium]
MSVSGRVALRGIPASHGVAVGPVVMLDRSRGPVPRHTIEPAQVSAEIERLRAAIEASRQEIEAVRDSLAESAHSDYGLILEAHLLMHRDELLVDAACRRIQRGKINAEWALRRTVDELKLPLEQAGSGYFRERAADVEHVGQHIQRHLTGEGSVLPPVDAPSILIATDLSPADAARLLRSEIRGLVTATGGATGHTALLARALEIPAVVGVRGVLAAVDAGEPAIVDGLSGEVVLRPDPAEVGRAASRAARHMAFVRGLRERHDSPDVTADGVPFEGWANIELPAEAALVAHDEAPGIGLYRTEFLYLGREQAPSEDEQTRIYSDVVSVMAPGAVVFRTFDLGGDKLPAHAAPCANPALGLRAIRLSLADPDFFREQVRAILRAGAAGSAKLMFPLVSTLSELRQARALVERCASELEAEGVAFSRLPVGLMIEVPSAALMAQTLAAEVDFFSVGTNDLVQYTLAVDRGDARLAPLASSLDPAVLRLLDMTARAAEGASIGLSMCGDMASDPIALPLVLGLGYRRLSVPLSSRPLVREVARRVRLEQARELATEALGVATAEEVRALLVAGFGAQLGELWREEGLEM